MYIAFLHFKRQLEMISQVMMNKVKPLQLVIITLAYYIVEKPLCEIYAGRCRACFLLERMFLTSASIYPLTDVSISKGSDQLIIRGGSGLEKKEYCSNYKTNNVAL